MDFFLIIYTTIIATIIIAYISFNKWREKKKREEKIETLPHIDIDIENISQEQKELIQLKEIKKIYIQQIDLENKIDKIYECMNDIKFCVQLITVIIIIPIIIKIIAIATGASILSNL